jgi:small-conductance mechanosensitive channel
VERISVSTEPSPAEPKTGHRGVWIWVSALLVAVAVGVLVWGLSVRSDLDSTQKDLDQANAQVAQLQTQAEQNEGVADTFVTAAKGAYEELTAQLGVATEDLAATTAELETAQQAAEQAEQTAAAAKEKASQASGAVEEAQATAEQARADADVAKTKATVVADCAKASLSAVGELFAGDSVRDQLAAVKSALQTIGADCKTALAGTS